MKLGNEEREAVKTEYRPLSYKLLHGCLHLLLTLITKFLQKHQQGSPHAFVRFCPVPQQGNRKRTAAAPQ